MGIFQFKKEEKENKEEKKEELVDEKKAKLVDDKQKPEIKAVDENKTDKTVKAVSSEKSGKKESDLQEERQSEIAYRVLIEPWVTERSHNLMALNKYVFKVAGHSNKNQIKKAIEELYNVKVIKINIINILPKKRNFARKTGWKSGYKKAIATLKEGDKIEMSNH